MTATYALVGLVHWAFDQVSIWNHYEMKRPIVMGPVMGLIMGDVTQGCLIGATLELMYLGIINVGGIQSSDPAYATTLACAFVIFYGYGVAEAAVITVPFGYIGNYLHKLVYFVNSFYCGLFDKMIEKDQMKAYNWVYPILPTIANSINGVSIFLGLLAGQTFFTNLHSALPEWLLTGWNAAAAMLPAIGLAMLLYFLWDKKKLVYFFLGFALVAYMQMNTLLIAFIGVTFAVVDFYRNKALHDLEQKMQRSQASSNDDEGGFFE